MAKELTEILMVYDNVQTNKVFFTLTDKKTRIEAEPMFNPVILNLAVKREERINDSNTTDVADYYVVGDPVKVNFYVNNEPHLINRIFEEVNLDLRPVQYYRKKK